MAENNTPLEPFVRPHGRHSLLAMVRLRQVLKQVSEDGFGTGQEVNY